MIFRNMFLQLIIFLQQFISELLSYFSGSFKMGFNML